MHGEYIGKHAIAATISYNTEQSAVDDRVFVRRLVRVMFMLLLVSIVIISLPALSFAFTRRLPVRLVPPPEATLTDCAVILEVTDCSIFFVPSPEHGQGDGNNTSGACWPLDALVTTGRYDGGILSQLNSSHLRAVGGSLLSCSVEISVPAGAQYQQFNLPGVTIVAALPITSNNGQLSPQCNRSSGDKFSLGDCGGQAVTEANDGFGLSWEAWDTNPADDVVRESFVTVKSSVKGGDRLQGGLRVGGSGLRLVAGYGCAVGMHIPSLHASTVDVRASQGAVTLKNLSWSERAAVELLAGRIHLETDTGMYTGAHAMGVVLNYTTARVDACITASRLLQPSQTQETNLIVLRGIDSASEDNSDGGGSGSDDALSSNSTSGTALGPWPLNVRLEMGSLAVVALLASNLSTGPTPSQGPHHPAQFVLTSGPGSALVPQLVLGQDAPPVLGPIELEKIKAIRAWISEKSWVKHVAYVRIAGYGASAAVGSSSHVTFIFTTSKTFLHLPPWLLSIVSIGMLRPRIIDVEVSVNECPLLLPLATDRPSTTRRFALIAELLKDILGVGPTEGLALVSPRHTLTFARRAEGRFYVATAIKLTNAVSLYLAVILSFVISALGALASWFVVLPLVFMAIRTYNLRRKRRFRFLEAKKTWARGTWLDGEATAMEGVMLSETKVQRHRLKLEQKHLESCGTSSSRAMRLASIFTEEDSELPGPFTLTKLWISVQLIRLRLKFADWIFFGTIGGETTAQLNVLNVRDKRLRDYSVPHVCQASGLLLGEFRTQYVDSLKLFIEAVTDLPSREEAADAAGDATADSAALRSGGRPSAKAVPLSQLAREYELFCFLNNYKVRGRHKIACQQSQASPHENLMLHLDLFCSPL
jgi:hypothetical protein